MFFLPEEGCPVLPEECLVLPEGQECLVLPEGSLVSPEEECPVLPEEGCIQIAEIMSLDHRDHVSRS